MIDGTVYGDGKPLAGVPVSNGVDIVRTDATGSYALRNGDAEYPFVFVNVPAGWEPEGKHFRRTDTPGVHDFQLRRAEVREGDGVRIAHVSDLHLGAPPRECFVTPADLRADLERVVHESRPHFLIVTGDLTNLGTVAELEAYAKITENLGVPVVSLTAGHDHLEEYDALAIRGETELSSRRTHRILGVDQYSFDWGPYHILLYPETYRERRRAQRLRAFMEHDLSLQPPGTPVVVVTHDPPRVFPDRQPHDYGPSASELLRYPAVTLIAHGQYHIARVVRHGGTSIVGVPSLSMGPIDTHAPGYALYELWNGRATVSLRPLLRSGAGPLVSRPAAAGARSGESAADAELLWLRRIDGSFHRSQPTWYGDSGGEGSPVLIVPTSDMGAPESSGIYAFRATDGSVAWSAAMPEVVKNGCVCDGDAVVAVTVAGAVRRLEADSGRIVWERRLPTYPDRWIHTKPVVANGRIYIVNAAVRSCLDLESGASLWHVHEPGLWDNAYAAPYQEPLHHETGIWFVDHRFRLLCVDLATGTISTEVDLALTDDNRAAKGERARMFQSQIASPVACGSMIVAPGAADQIGAVDAGDRDGCELHWLLPVVCVDGADRLRGDGRSTRPLEFVCGMAPSGSRVFVTTARGDVLSVRVCDGAVLWRTSLGMAGMADMVPYYRGTGLLLTKPVVHGKHVYVGGSDGNVHVVNAEDGAPAGKIGVGTPVTVPPVLVDETVTVFGYDGRVSAFRLSW